VSFRDDQERRAFLARCDGIQNEPRVVRSEIWNRIIPLSKYCFRSMSWKKDFWIGVIFTIATIWLQSAANIGPISDWEDHPVTLVVTIALPLLGWLALDCLWRALRIVNLLSRENAGVRRLVRIGVRMLFGAAAFSIVIGWVVYQRSSHFRCEFYKDFAISHVTELPNPNSSVLFHVAITNTGKPSTTRNWRLKARLVSGDYLTSAQTSSHESFFKSLTSYKAKDFIYEKTKDIAVQPGETVVGVAEFIFWGVRSETLLPVGTKLILEFEDGDGKHYSIKTRVPAEEITTQQP
jgi:hypothetical protein